MRGLAVTLVSSVREVWIGTVAPFQLESSTVLFTGPLIAGDFFEGLQATQTDNGRQFAKSSNIETEFPSSLTVRLHDLSGVNAGDQVVRLG